MIKTTKEGKEKEKARDEDVETVGPTQEEFDKLQEGIIIYP